MSSANPSTLLELPDGESRAQVARLIDTLGITA